MNYTIRHLSKSFGKRRAVKDVSLDLHCGIYGLLGANGAGKTTLLRMLGGILPPDQGELKLNGQLVSYRKGLSGKTGFLPQYPGFYPQMSAEEFLQFMAAVKGIDPDEAASLIPELLQQTGLADRADTKIRSFSGGMKQRLGLAQALLGDPEILILDEPTAGLDPKERIRFRNLLASLSRDKIILLSTHIVTDIESLADQIVVMKKGQVLMEGSSSELTKILDNQVWKVSCSPAECQKLMASYPISREEAGLDGMTVLRLVSSEKPHPAAHRAQPDLEDVFLFLELTDKEKEMDEDAAKI